uniref:ATPase subunit 8 n=1 Tax=Odontella aurita TaxID=265563 RepID=UPI002027B24E|nr:ATPase subunit 8 [Odontella aurita]QYB22938.1 ATPase subunit 8 [Odontella aurita]
MKRIIPQFDILTVGAQVFGLLVTLLLFYYYSITSTIPYFIEIKKFRTKKLLKNKNFVNTIDTDLNCNVWLINYCYKHFLK